MSFHQFPVRFGKYIVLDRISAGGMAEVYRAKEIREDGFSPIIAIKRMLPSNGGEEQALTPMFVDEAKLASLLHHPNIAQTYELGRVDDDLYIAMELVWGRDLRSIAKAVTKSRQPFPVAFACYIVAKAAEALDFAHNAKLPDGRPMHLVHRDVSPHNLMLASSGDVKVIDFGVAKAESKSNETVAGVIKGKFSYMAPEQVLGGAIDARTDIFALGIVLYELLTSERLYDGSSAFSIFDKVVNLAAPVVSDSGTQVPPGLDDVVARCLAKKSDDRFQNAGELADALAPFLIHNRTIFGPRDAQAIFRSLFPGDDDDMRERTRRYEAVREADCVDMRLEIVSRHEGGGGGMTEVLASSDVGFLAPAATGESEPTNWMPSEEKQPEHATQFLEQRTTANPRLKPLTAAETPPAQPALASLTPRKSRSTAIAIGAIAAVLAVCAVGATYWVGTQSDTPPPEPPLVQQPIIVTPTAPDDAPRQPAVGITTSPLPQPAADPAAVADPAPGVDPAPVVDPAPEPDPAPTPTPTPTPRVPRPGNDTRRPPQPAQPKEDKGFGYVTIGAKGVQSAKVLIDGKDVGYAPVLGYKLKLGKHDLKIIPVRDEMPGAPHVRTITVTKDSSQANPLRVNERFD